MRCCFTLESFFIMSSFITNTTKLGKALGGRIALFEAIAEVSKPISRKKEKLVEIIKDKASLLEKSSLGQKLKVAKEYAIVEMTLPTMSEIPLIKKDLAHAKRFIATKSAMDFTVKEAFVTLLVCLEVALWFFLGETIGKRHIVGYLV